MAMKGHKISTNIRKFIFALYLDTYNNKKINKKGYLIKPQNNDLF